MKLLTIYHKYKTNKQNMIAYHNIFGLAYENKNKNQQKKELMRRKIVNFFRITIFSIWNFTIYIPLNVENEKRKFKLFILQKKKNACAKCFRKL